MSEHLLGMQKVPGSIPGISSYKDQVRRDVKDLCKDPGDPLPVRVGNTDY